MISPVIFNKLYRENCFEIIYSLDKVPYSQMENRIDKIVNFEEYISNNDFLMDEHKLVDSGLKLGQPFAFGVRILMHKASVLVLDFDDIDKEIIETMVENLKNYEVVNQIDTVISTMSHKNTPKSWHIYCGLNKLINTIDLLSTIDTNNMCKGYLNVCKQNMAQVIRVSKKFAPTDEYSTKPILYSTYLRKDKKEWEEYILERSIVPSIIQDGQSQDTTQIQKKFVLNLRAL